MRKCLFLVCLLSTLAACAVQDENYYRKNPHALEQALKKCPTKQPPNVSCEQLVAMAVSVNELAYQLQSNPQSFGKKILSLQESLAKQQINLQENPNREKVDREIDSLKQQLAERLAIVKWLESPES